MAKPPLEIMHLQVPPVSSTDQTTEADLAAKTRAVKESLKDAAAGRVVGYEEVDAWLESWGTDNELPPPSVPDAAS